MSIALENGRVTPDSHRLSPSHCHDTLEILQPMLGLEIIY